MQIVYLCQETRDNLLKGPLSFVAAKCGPIYILHPFPPPGGARNTPALEKKLSRLEARGISMARSNGLSPRHHERQADPWPRMRHPAGS